MSIGRFEPHKRKSYASFGLFNSWPYAIMSLSLSLSSDSIHTVLQAQLTVVER